MAIFVTVLTSCGGAETDGGTVGPTVVPVASVAISPSGTTQLTVGGSATFTATALSAAGATLGGKTATWTTSSSPIATVSSGGVVTAVGAGTANITATIEGISASVQVVVGTPLPSLVDVVAGNNQSGLVGKAHADSLIVRVRTAAGGNATGASVAWTATGGFLSNATTTTDANGLARVQWFAGSGNLTATASVVGAAPITFNANGRANGACVLTPTAATSRFSLGPTDLTLSLNATAALKIAVIYVDFPDAPATETPATLMLSVVDPGIALLRELSANRVNITPTSFPKWYRMSKPIAQYDWTTYAGHRAYLDEALSVADAEVNFSTFDAVYVFAPPNSNKPISPTFNGGTTSGIVHDGRNFGNAVTFGRDSRNYYGPAILAHETGHMFGLVDLYTFDASGSPYTGDQFRYIGAWSLMSNVFNPGHYLMWEKRKLGFTTVDQVDCLEGNGGEEVVIQPNAGTNSGVKMVAVKLDAARALVVEARDKSGIDGNLCATGVLIYEVNAANASGYGPVSVRGSRITTSGAAYTKCGPWADGTYGVGAGNIATYTDAASGTTVTVLAAEAAGAYRVRVKRS